jgi:hypothetical protein
MEAACGHRESDPQQVHCQKTQIQFCRTSSQPWMLAQKVLSHFWSLLVLPISRRCAQLPRIRWTILSVEPRIAIELNLPSVDWTESTLRSKTLATCLHSLSNAVLVLLLRIMNDCGCYSRPKL